MKKINALFLFCIFCFLSLQIMLFSQINLPEAVTSYVADFLCMPIVLTICLWSVQYVKNNRKIRLPATMVFALTLFYSIFFEAVLPFFHPRYTADIVDVAFYFAGAGLYFFIQKI